MGLREFLFGNQRAAPWGEDVIWLNQPAKRAGLVGAIGDRLKDSRLVLLVVHFPASLNALAALLTEHGVEHTIWDRSLDGTEVRRQAELAAGPRLLLVPAAALVASDPLERLDKGAPQVAIIVAERHPLPAHDEAIEQFVRGLPVRGTLSHHLSLDDPVMRVFAGDWVKGVLAKLGAKDDEPIVSVTVARRLRDAQRKIEQQATGDSLAQAAEEWFARHCPGMLPPPGQAGRFNCR